MLRRPLLALGMVLSFSTLALAAQQAGLTGRWSARLGEEPVVYNLTAAADAVTGAMSFSNYGFDAPVSGTVKGDSLFFDVDAGGTMISHRGRVVGDTIFFSINAAGSPMRVKAARAK
jgi:hypothetical protein